MADDNTQTETTISLAQINFLRQKIEITLGLLKYLSEFAPLFQKDPATGNPVRPKLQVYALDPDTEMIELVNSIRYRFNALTFQINVYNRLIEEVKDTDFTDYRTDKDKFGISARHYFDSLFILDNVVFNSYSIFDYYGKLIIKVLYKQVRINVVSSEKIFKFTNKNSNWDSLVELASSRLDGLEIDNKLSSAKDKIIDTHSVFVSRLSAYRNRIIHNEASKASHRIDNQSGKLIVYAPREFVNEIGFTRRQPKQKINEVPIYHAIEDLITRVCDSVGIIGSELQKSMMAGNL